jgi:hypothetical protein
MRKVFNISQVLQVGKAGCAGTGHQQIAPVIQVADGFGECSKPFGLIISSPP